MGAPCERSADCASGVCIPRIDEPIGGGVKGVCTTACTADTDCVGGWKCQGTSSGVDLCHCKRQGLESLNGADDDCNGLVDDVCPLTQCFEWCVDTKTDPNHCGACLNQCIKGTCENGACTCKPGLTLCGSTCVDTERDVSACGKCGTVCEPSRECRSGSCLCGIAPCERVSATKLGLTGSSLSRVVAGKSRLAYVGNTGYSLNADLANWITKADGGGSGAIAFTRGQLRLAVADEDIVLATREQGGGPTSVVGCAGATCNCRDTASACRNVLSGDDPIAFAAHAGNAYWSLGDGTIKKCAITGCGGNPLTLATTPTRAEAIVVDDTGVYVAYGPTVARVDLTGGPVTELGAVPSAVSSLAIDGTTIYAGYGTGIATCAKTGCSGGAASFASSTSTVIDLKSRGADVWWQAAKTVYRCTKGASCLTPTVITTGTESFDVDGQFVYIATLRSIYSLGL